MCETNILKHCERTVGWRKEFADFDECEIWNYENKSSFFGIIFILIACVNSKGKSALVVEKVIDLQWYQYMDMWAIILFPPLENKKRVWD